MKSPTPHWQFYSLLIAFIIMVIIQISANSTEKKERIKNDAITTLQYDSIMKMESKILNKLSSVNGTTKRVKGI